MRYAHNKHTEQNLISKAQNKQCTQTRDGTLAVLYAHTRARAEGWMRMCRIEKVEERVRLGQHES